MKAEIVIGSGFGDEGKGLFTDYLSSRVEGSGCVVRFNGGAQAGHTVETSDGKRHVFSHFGSGSFNGSPTYLSSFFVCNPIVLLREREELSRMGITPRLYADPTCPVTTPYDIMINQIVEQTRGNKRHGSVGVGFGETLERQSYLPYALCLIDLISTNTLRQKLDAIRLNWVPFRLASLNVRNLEEKWQNLFSSEDIRERFIDDIARFLECITPAPLESLSAFDHLVFEGAQGLLLDQERGWFPHVTRSYTGLKNVLSLAEKIGLKAMDVYYATRSYATRHGAGPLPHELPHLPYDGIVDKTNKPNPYQGSLRFAWLDLDLFRDTVLRDLADSARRFDIRPHLAMSCVDQIKGSARYVVRGTMRRASPEAFLVQAKDAIGALDMLASYGPTRTTMQSGTGIGKRNDLSQPLNVVKDDNVTVKRDKPLLNKSGELFVDALA